VREREKPMNYIVTADFPTNKNAFQYKRTNTPNKTPLTHVKRLKFDQLKTDCCGSSLK
jgi:hypothetical protein